MNKIENRPLGTNEKVYWVLDQKTSTQFAVVAEINGNATDQAWRQALDTVQKRHPNLSVQILGNEYSTAYLKHVDDCKIPLKIIYTKTDENWNSVIEEVLNQPFDITIAPLVRAVLIQQPGKSVFIFISNHSIGDGMSVTLVIRDVLTVLSGSTIDMLMPLSSLDELAGVPLRAVENQKINGFMQLKNSLVSRSEVTVSRRKFSRTLTEKLIERAKREETTVHGVLSAAIVLALKQINTSMHEEPVRILHPLSARRSLSIGDDFGMLINIVTLPYNPAPEHTFWNFAREVRQGIASTQSAGWIQDDINATKELFHNGLDVNTIEQALHQGTAHEIMLTNLGQLSFPTDYAGLALTSLWGPMVLTPHESAQTIGVATFNGALTLTLTGLSPSSPILEAVDKIIDIVCNTEQDIQIDSFYQYPVTDLLSVDDHI